MRVFVRRALPKIMLRRISLGAMVALVATLPASPQAAVAVTTPSAVPDFEVAKKPAPAALNKALRERAAQFLQFTVERSFSKAYDLVAPETKDWYLSSGKPQYTSFKIESIDYSKNYKDAMVHSRVTRVLSMNGREVSSELLVPDLWKFEGGKWMWYHDPNVMVTPFGEIKMDRSRLAANPGAPPVPRDTSPNAVLDAAKGLSMEASVNKKELLFEDGKPGSDELVFHNGLAGVVDVLIDIVGDYRDFSVEPKHVQLEGKKDLTVKVEYKPAPNPSPAFVRLTVEPFERTLQIPLKFKTAGQ
jgi:hypothetical protein